MIAKMNMGEMADLSVNKRKRGATSFCSDDKMTDAVDQAYGAVIVKDGQIVGEGPSRVTISKDPTAHKAKKYFGYGVKSCWLVIPGLKSVYEFSDATIYQIFRDDQTLMDTVLNVQLELKKVFR